MGRGIVEKKRKRRRKHDGWEENKEKGSDGGTR